MNILEYLILTVRLPDGRHVPTAAAGGDRASTSPHARVQADESDAAP